MTEIANGDSPEVKAVVGFGTKDALAGATPKAIKIAYRVVLFLSGFWAIVIEPQFPGISEHVAHNIDKWLMVSNTAIYFICQSFGWVVPNAKQTTDV